MKSNLGALDRGIRIGVGVAMIVATLTGVIGAWGWIGVVLIGTGALRFCQAYLPFGLNTCKLRK